MKYMFGTFWRQKKYVAMKNYLPKCRLVHRNLGPRIFEITICPDDLAHKRNYFEHPGTHPTTQNILFWGQATS